jgi:hypothetical protein
LFLASSMSLSKRWGVTFNYCKGPRVLIFTARLSASLLKLGTMLLIMSKKDINVQTRDSFHPPHACALARAGKGQRD